VALKSFVSTFVILMVVVLLLPSQVAAQAPPQPQWAQPPPPPVKRVFLNGQAIDDIRAVTLIDMKVSLDTYGNILLFNPAYHIERRPGAAAQIVRKAATVARPISGRVFLITDVEGKGPPTFDLQVYVSGRLVSTVDGSQPRTSLDSSEFFTVGDNVLHFKAVSVHRPQSSPDTKVKVTFGYGQPNGQVLAIDRVLLTYERSGRVQSQIDKRTITFEK